MTEGRNIVEKTATQPSNGVQEASHFWHLIWMS